MPIHDLVIRGGQVADGLGGEVRTADVAVDGGRVTAVGRVDGSARHVVQVDGALVAPGWVDVHTHYDGQATWDAHLAPSAWHGVTTVVMGNCGVGFAPVRDADHQRLIELMEGVEDLPGTVLHAGLAWDWDTFESYLGALDERRRDVDVATQVPHGALRLHVMGERGARREPATAEEIDEMGRLAAAAVKAGALGFTTSRTINHRTSRGEPTPTLTAAREELVGIAAAVGRTGRGVLQMVGDFVDFDDEFATLRAMVTASGRPLSFTVIQSPVVPELHDRMLAAIDDAQADGLPIKGQVATRAIGLLFGLECTLDPLMTNPVMRGIRSLPLAEARARMNDAGFRDRVLAAQTAERDKSKVGGGLINRWHHMFAMADPPDYEPPADASVAARAEALGVDPVEVAYDLLAAGEMIYLPFMNYADGNLEAVAHMLAHPHTVPGLSDGGAHVGTICDASFPTFLLTHWRSRFDLGWLVGQHTRATAELVGLRDRGVLAPGYRADINVIDLDNVEIRRPEMVSDLPGGGRRVVQRAEGYLHTFVAGAETYRAGQATGELPGRLIRGPQTV